MIRRFARSPRPASPARAQRFRHEAGQDPATALLGAVQAGARDELPLLLADLDDRTRRALLPELKSLRKDGSLPTDTRGAAYLAAAGCHTVAVACATWLTGAHTYDQDPHLLAAVLAGRPPEFLTRVLARLAARSDMGSWEFALARTLADTTGLPLPLTEATGIQWLFEAHDQHYARCPHRRHRRRGEQPAERGTPCGGLLAALREDPLTPRMMPHLIDTPELTGQLVWQSCRASEHRIDTWHGTYAALAAEGVLDRADLMATAVTILLRGTWPLGGVRFCVALLRALEPTADEYAARTGDWIRIAADAPSVAAVYAQEVLRGLWDTDRLTSAQLAETARAVFFRTEKQPVRGQLSWLEAALRRTPQDAPVLLPALGDAFGYADTTLQQRALRLAGRHLTHAGPAAREELIGAAALLRPGLLTTAADLFDAPELLPERTGPRDRPRDTLPEPRAAAPLPPAPQSAEEFTAEFAAVLAASLRSRATVASYEWVLDGMVRLAHRDREALAKALEPLAQRHADWLHHNNWPRYGGFNLLALLAAATGRVSSADIKRVRRATAHKDCPHTRFSTPWRRRLAEITALLVTGPVPPHLLATPSRDSGELHPEDLLTRLHLYATQGAEPAPADLDLALLRLRHPADPATLADLVARAHALDTPEGRRLARWLEAPPKPAPAAERTLVKSAKDRTRIQLTEAASRELNRAFPALSAVGDGFRPGTRYCGCVYRSARYWVSLCPDRPDTLAVHLIPLLAEAAVGTERIDTGLLLTLAEAPGPPGPALHLALAHGLSARHPDDRLATVDALLTLAARDTLDAHRLGTELAELLSLGAVKANRVADAFTTLVSANAPATAWSVLAALLPPLLATEAAPPRGTGDLLAAAATGAEECGARDSAPWLTDLATRKGGSRLLTEARRLHQALTG